MPEIFNSSERYAVYCSLLSLIASITAHSVVYCNLT